MGQPRRVADDHDGFARSSLRVAQQRIRALEAEVKALATRVPARPLFHGRCSLCGEPCNPRSRYCHAHAWAEGQTD